MESRFWARNWSRTVRKKRSILPFEARFITVRGACRGRGGGVNFHILLPVVCRSGGGFSHDEILAIRGLDGCARRRRIGAERGTKEGIRRFSGHEVLLVLMLERGDPTRLVRISLGEMNQGALRRAGTDALGWRMGARKMAPEVGLAAQPSCEPAIGGGDGKRKAPQAPDAMQGLAFSGLMDQRDEGFGGEVGMGDQVAPKYGEGAAAAFVAAAI